MKKLSEIFEQICSFIILYEAYLMARKNKRYNDEVLEFSANLGDNLIQLQKELRNKTYKVGKYKKFYVYIPKKRLIMALPFKDRIVQWAIYLVLCPIYDKRFIYDSYGCRVGKGMHRAAKRVQYWERLTERKLNSGETAYYLKLDVSKYFYRVAHDTIIQIFRNDFKDEDLIWLIDLYVNNDAEPFGLPKGVSPDECLRNEMLYDVGMPIGSLLSQLIANIYLNELDQYVKHVLKVRHYIRYMDDVIILSKSKEELHCIKNEIEKFLNEKLQLDLNNKTCIRPIRQGADFVGCKIYPTHIKIKKPTALRIKRYLKHLKMLYAEGEISFEKIDRKVQSYLGLLSQFDTHNLTEKIFDNFVLRRGPKLAEQN